MKKRGGVVEKKEEVWKNEKKRRCGRMKKKRKCGRMKKRGGVEE